MNHNIYFAARFKRAEELRSLAAELEYTANVHITSSWLKGTDGDEKDHDNASDEEKQTYALRDLDDLARADTLVYFAPAGRHGGCHVELGIALGSGKTVLFVGEKENVFHWLPGIICLRNTDELASYVRARFPRQEQSFVKSWRLI